MNLGSIERRPQRNFGSGAPTKAMFRVAASHHLQQRFFQVLGVAAGEQSAALRSTAAAAMTGRTAIKPRPHLASQP
jgi:hypothetical protein